MGIRQFGIRHLIAAAALVTLSAGVGVRMVPQAFADGAGVTAEAPKAAISDLLEPKAFTDPITGMSINWPKGWVANEGIQHTGYEAPKADEDETGSLAVNVVLTSAKTPGLKVADFPDVIKSAKEAYAKKFDGFKESKDDSKVKVDGKPTEIMAYSFLVQKTVKIEQRQFWVMSNGNIYIITFASLASTFEKNRPLMDAMIKTIKIP